MTKPVIAGPQAQAWATLAAAAPRLRATPTRALFAADKLRFEHYSVDAAGLMLDFSRQRVDGEVLCALCDLADQVSLRAQIEAQFAGEAINHTEGRAVLHTALRRPAGSVPLVVGGVDIDALVRGERARVLKFAEGVRNGTIAASDGGKFTLVINIGIGGSDLGPAMAVEALRPFAAGAPRVAFASNVDGVQLADIMATADPRRTLVIVCSKTFVTQETRSNALVARAWLRGALGEAAARAHFAAVSVNAAAMDDFGIHPDYRFAMWDWVGGRYSIWSSIGVALAIAIGAKGFEQFLAGGAEMDAHFRGAPWHQNLPALMGLLGAWNVDFLGLPTLAVLPYDYRLARLPAYLQQLEMESNGKHVQRDGSQVSAGTCPVIWGEPGNNAQHSFFQLLHQGVARAALDFVMPARSSCDSPELQLLASANCLAQAEAFAFGQDAATVEAELKASGMPAARIAELVPHKVHEGNRPSSLVLFRQLDPTTLGRLIALYEHKVYTQSVVWGINAYDQWGVELGKKLCERFLPYVRDPASEGVPASLKGALGYLARER
jgi:glucose-6-phosphate isomerase